MVSTPTPPDPYQTADAQTKSNVATATAQQGMNMVDQSNPYGSTKYSQTGTNPDGTPKYSVSTSFSPSQQGLFDQSNALKSGQMSTAQQLMNSGQGVFSGSGPDLSYNGTTAALDKLNAARLDPQWAQNTDQQESKLANQGITPGTPAYDNAMRVFNQGKNDAYNSANLADYQTSSANALAQYNSPLQSYLGLTQGTAPQSPTAGNVTTPQTSVAGTNISGLINSNYQQQSANANAQNGQLAGLFGTGLGALTGGAMGGLFGSGSNVGSYGQTANATGLGAGTGGMSFPMF